MFKTYLYIPDELNEKINRAVRAQKKSKAEILRTVLKEGLSSMERQNFSGAETLLELAKIGKKGNFRGIHDSSRMDDLLWGRDWE